MAKKESFDDFLDEYYQEIRNAINNSHGKVTDYQEIIDQVKKKIKNERSTTNGRDYSKTDFASKLRKNFAKNKEAENPPREEKPIINEKINTMNLGQSNFKEATKYAKLYKYSVKVDEYRYPNKLNFVFRLDNTPLKKILNKPWKRLDLNHQPATYQRIVFTYKPREARKMMKVYKTPSETEDVLVNFTPFEIIVTTENCHELIYYHTPDNGNKAELLKAVYILDVEKVIDKLNVILDDTYISDNGKANMATSVRKHLSNVQSEEKYGVSDWEDYCGLTQDNALMVMDDLEDEQLLSSLLEYLQ